MKLKNKKDRRKLKRLNRKTKEAEVRVNDKILKRIEELRGDKELMMKIDKEIEKNGYKKFIERAWELAKRDGVQAG